MVAALNLNFSKKGNHSYENQDERQGGFERDAPQPQSDSGSRLEGQNECESWRHKWWPSVSTAQPDDGARAEGQDRHQSRAKSSRDTYYHLTVECEKPGDPLARLCCCGQSCPFESRD